MYTPVPAAFSSRRGHSGYSKTRGKGFTLIEVFMVLALLGALGALVIINMDRLLEPSSSRPSGEIPALAVRFAHDEARRLSQPVYLYWHEEEKALKVADSLGSVLKHFPFPGDPETSRWEVRLYRMLPVAQGRNTAMTEPEAWPVVRLEFHPSGTTAVFQISVSEGFDERIHRFDAFSGSPLSAVQDNV